MTRFPYLLQKHFAKPRMQMSHFSTFTESPQDTLWNALGFGLLIFVFLLFRGVIRWRRGQAMGRIEQAFRSPPPLSRPFPTCPRCTMPVVPGATFCGRCGWALARGNIALPPARRRSLLLFYVIAILLAFIGLAALFLVGKPQGTPMQMHQRFEIHEPRFIR